MKQELFKEMYDMVKLDGRQKEKILASITARQDIKKNINRKRGYVPFVTICACIALLIGVPVIAASTGVAGRIIQAFNLLNIDKQEFTDKQKTIYSKYGTILDNEIILESGILELEAVICDKNFIVIPFSIEPADKGKPYKMKQNENIRFCLAGNINDRMGTITILPKEVQEDGTLKGCYLLNVEEKIEEGDEVVVKIAEKWDDDNGKTVSKFKIQKIAESYNIPLDKKLIKQKDMNPIYNMEISTLSLRIEGNNNPNNTTKRLMADLAYYDITVELKDGTVVKQADSGSWGMGCENYDYTKTILFASPVDLSEVAGVRMEDKDGELWIPAGDL